MVPVLPVWRIVRFGSALMITNGSVALGLIAYSSRNESIGIGLGSGKRLPIPVGFE